ncbi:hypothetical protein EYF80_051064 [Liparis tanakae]|uniref:Uncharacterized protein n=1 Tax=Liparis tanakae TaxID=230148 RepID=A0A4Z2FEC8_9TELE|nr:hypothetical protein EYF80_051064 [Liparis tanakae]
MNRSIRSVTAIKQLQSSELLPRHSPTTITCKLNDLTTPGNYSATFREGPRPQRATQSAEGNVCEETSRSSSSTSFSTSAATTSPFHSHSTLASAAVINIINNDGSASRCQLQEHLMKDFIRVISMSASYHDLAKCVLSALCQINYLQTLTTGGEDTTATVFNVYFSVVNSWLSSHIWLFRLVTDS